MKFIDEVNLKNEKIILRCDFNVPISNGVIEDESRLKQSIKTINYLLSKNCSIIILSHLGRVKEQEDLLKNSLKSISKRLSKLLNKEITFFEDKDRKKAVEKAKNLKSGEIILLENTRFYDYQGNFESGNNLKLAKYWASLGTIFVNDAFATLHRIHSSTAGISNYLPTYYGLLVKQELSNLKALVTQIKHPYTVFMGASKIDDKIKYMEGILEKCDHLLLGGGVANSFLHVLGIELGDSFYSHDTNTLEKVKKILNKYKRKIVLPIDFKIVENQIRDIGPKTILQYQNYCETSNTIFMNGTPGQFEKEAYARGTIELLKSLEKLDAIKIAGGGATLNAISKFNCEDSFTYLSTGGGASLEYISSGNLSAINYIEEHQKNRKIESR